MPRRSILCELDAEILEVLPASVGPGLWLTGNGVALLVHADPELVRHRLRALADRRVVVDDWRLPPAFARTLQGDCALFRALGAAAA